MSERTKQVFGIDYAKEVDDYIAYCRDMAVLLPPEDPLAVDLRSNAVILSMYHSIQHERKSWLAAHELHDDLREMWGREVIDRLEAGEYIA